MSFGLHIAECVFYSAMLFLPRPSSFLFRDIVLKSILFFLCHLKAVPWSYEKSYENYTERLMHSCVFSFYQQHCWEHTFHKSFAFTSKRQKKKMHSYAIKVYTDVLLLHHVHVHGCHMVAGCFYFFVSLKFFCLQGNVADQICSSRWTVQVLL